MRREPVYLRHDVLFEPLFNQWLAFYPLIPPAQAATFVAQSHVRVLQSFVDNPELHAQAVKNPAFAGGAFVDIDPARVEEVRALLERTRQRCKPALELAEAMRALEALLSAKAKGASLEPLYAEVPEALKGLVELTYDLRHSPSARFLEGPLYRSRYYLEDVQGIALSRLSEDRRPFVMSTPRLEGPGRLHLPVRFRDEALDRLFRMKWEGGSPDEVAEVLRVPAAERALFESFFTSEPSPPAPRFQGPGLRLRFFGHACVLLESREASVLIDPLVSYRYPSSVPRYTYADLPERLDYVLLTHIHADHVVPEALLQLRHRIGAVVVPRGSGNGLLDPSMRWVLKSLGFARVVELDELETLCLDGLEVTGVPFLGEHCDLRIGSKIAHWVKLGGRTVLAATDSNALEPRMYEQARELLGPLDVLLLGTECEGAPISYGYGNFFFSRIPREIDQSRRQSGSGSASASEIVRRLRPRHVQNYAMGLEPWLRHLFPPELSAASPQIREGDAFIAYCRSEGIEAGRPQGRFELVV